jgi:mono/diheme cytochrome c family protein
MRMRTMRGWLVVLLVVSGALLWACGGSAPSTDPPAATTESTSGETAAIDGAALLEERCADCHGLNRVTGERLTQEEWQQVVTSMIGRGAVLNAQEETVLVVHLAETYKP